jgi:predicted nucleic acid-binding protein
VAERALVDTSVFIAAESGRPLDEELVARYETCVSIFTLAELRVGVGLADRRTRQRRARTLAVAERYEVLRADERVAEQFALLVVALRQARRRAGLMDTLIAATAAAESIPVLTQDADFGLIADHSDGSVQVVEV